MSELINSNKQIPIVILAGGQGTRLRTSIGNNPKILAPICQTTFLEILCSWLNKQGFSNIVFSLGYQASQVIEKLEQLDDCDSLKITYAVEASPLGTLGGIGHTLSSLNLDECIVINGDTFIDCSLEAFINEQKSASTFAGIIATNVDDVSRYGELKINNKTGMVTKFIEKQRSNNKPGWVNAGIYYFSTDAVSLIKLTAQGSIECDFLVNNVDRLKCHKITPACFIDIGTADSFSDAQRVLKEYI